MTSPENTGKKQGNTRFKRGQSGNPDGRPKGSRNAATVAAEALLDGETEALTRKAIELAKGGDLVAIRLCLERILPARRERPVAFDLPDLKTPADAVQASAAIAGAVSRGELTPGEAEAMARLVQAFAQSVMAHEHEKRLNNLEKGNHQ